MAASEERLRRHATTDTNGVSFGSTGRVHQLARQDASVVAPPKKPPEATITPMTSAPTTTTAAFRGRTDELWLDEDADLEALPGLCDAASNSAPSFWPGSSQCCAGGSSSAALLQDGEEAPPLSAPPIGRKGGGCSSASVAVADSSEVVKSDLMKSSGGVRSLDESGLSRSAGNTFYARHSPTETAASGGPGGSSASLDLFVGPTVLNPAPSAPCVVVPTTGGSASSSTALDSSESSSSVDRLARPSQLDMSGSGGGGSATTILPNPGNDGIGSDDDDDDDDDDRDADGKWNNRHRKSQNTGIVVRLQQSHSTPCPTPAVKGGVAAPISSAPATSGGASSLTSRKEAAGEYRRFRSEGSSAGARLLLASGPPLSTGAVEMAAAAAEALDELGSPEEERKQLTRNNNSHSNLQQHHHLHHHHHGHQHGATTSSAGCGGSGSGGGTSPAGRPHLFAQESIVGHTPLLKPHTEQMHTLMHTLKTKAAKYQAFIEKAFCFISEPPPAGSDERIVEGCTIVMKVMMKASRYKPIADDLSAGLCDYIREHGHFDALLALFLRPQLCDPVRLQCGRVLECCLSWRNCEHIVAKGILKRLVAQAEKLNKVPEQLRVSLALFERLFAHSNPTSLRLVDYGVLDHILLTVKRANDSAATLRHAALALANLALFSCGDVKKKMVQKKVPEWIFLLASQTDQLTRYYACLATCVLSCSKEVEPAVVKSGTLPLVETFLAAQQPVAFSSEHYDHTQGHPTDWLVRLLPVLASARREAKSIAAFHFTMEAVIKRDQQKLDLFQEIGAIAALKEVASAPDEIAAKFASEALTVIGEEVPYKLTQQVPRWTVDDVQYWVKKIGFEKYAENFAQNMVDGDILLEVTEHELKSDLGIETSLLRRRFMRELESLKIAADYSAVDDSQLDKFLMSIAPELSVYTYKMLGSGLNRTLLPQITDELMKTVCGIDNPIHRLKLRQALQDSKHIDDIEVALLSKQIDVFISYRRSTGNQLASLIKVLLQLRGYKVFIDVDKLYAGKFDSSLLKNIQAAKHFILVLTPNSLDRLYNDTNRDDWIHKELHCAFEHQKNVIPIFDQNFEFPDDDTCIPEDIRNITQYNGVRWVHDYQEACIDKVDRFIKGELNRTPSLSQPTAHSTKTGSASGSGVGGVAGTAAGHHHHRLVNGSGGGGCTPSASTSTINGHGASSANGNSHHQPQNGSTSLRRHAPATGRPPQPSTAGRAVAVRQASASSTGSSSTATVHRRTLQNGEVATTTTTTALMLAPLSNGTTAGSSGTGTGMLQQAPASAPPAPTSSSSLNGTGNGVATALNGFSTPGSLPSASQQQQQQQQPTLERQRRLAAKWQSSAGSVFTTA